MDIKTRLEQVESASMSFNGDMDICRIQVPTSRWSNNLAGDSNAMCHETVLRSIFYVELRSALIDIVGQVFSARYTRII